MNEFGRNTGFRHIYLVIDNLCDFLQFRSQSYLTTFYFKTRLLIFEKKTLKRSHSGHSFIFVLRFLLVLYFLKRKIEQKRKKRPTHIYVTRNLDSENNNLWFSYCQTKAIQSTRRNGTSK